MTANKNKCVACVVLLCLLPVLAVAEPLPDDPDHFLTFFNAISPAHAEDLVTASAYYRAIDPTEDRTTLAAWLTFNGFDTGADAEAVYVNDVDLGFGRHMFIKLHSDGRAASNATVASYVRNHSDNTPLVDPVDGSAEEKILNVHNDTNLIATVAMEYGPPPSNIFARNFTTFYAFGPDGERLTAADLDGRGAKAIPGACNICHGGAPRPLLSDGSYPEEGDTGAGFLPWDLDSFQYSSMLFDGVAKYSREEQEAQFKILNETLLETNTPTVIYDLIEGWYGGFGRPNDTFDGAFVPVPEWSGHFLTYLDEFAPNCRACHLMRNSAVDFSTYQKFNDLSGRAADLVFDRGTMPLAKRTYDKFWPDYSENNAGFIDLFGSVPVTRRPGNSPIAFAGVDRPALLGTAYQLDASLSDYATSYSWTMMVFPDGSTANLSNPNIVNPVFTPDLPGTYEFELTATNLTGSTTDRIKTVATIGSLIHVFTPTGIHFADDVVPLIDANCIGCHTSAFTGTAPPFDAPLVSTREEAMYRNLSLRANASDPQNSLMMLKSTGQISHGGLAVLTDPSAQYSMLIDWIAQGVLRAIDADDDALDDRLEPQIGTNPGLADTDGDLFYDSIEVYAGSDPNSGSSIPTGPVRISINRAGVPSDTSGFSGSPSGDGRTVALQSGGIVIKDTFTGRMPRADVDGGGSGTGTSRFPAMTPDGRYVAYNSASEILIFSDTNQEQDVFVTDMDTGEITRVSTDSFGQEADDGSATLANSVAISDDGRYVAFSSDATNLVADDNNFSTDVFVKDRQTGMTTRVSSTSNGAESDWDSFRASISADGQHVTFESLSTDLVPGDVNFFHDIFVKNTFTGVMTQVSTDSTGVQANAASFRASISDNGNYVAFTSDATNLVPNDTNGFRDAFVKNLVTNATERVSVDSFGNQGDFTATETAISADGRYVVFVSFSTNLVPDDTNGASDVFVRDLITSTTLRVSVDVNGLESNGNSIGAGISADGAVIFFSSDADNLIAGGTTGGNLYRIRNPFFPDDIDSDGDGVLDDVDNCVAVINNDQRDTNGDGFGNICDPDLDNNAVVNFLDIGIFGAAFLSTDPDADFNGDGVVNFLDYIIFQTFFLQPPGPSGLVP